MSRKSSISKSGSHKSKKTASTKKSSKKTTKKKTTTKKTTKKKPVKKRVTKKKPVKKKTKKKSALKSNSNISKELIRSELRFEKKLSKLTKEIDKSFLLALKKLFKEQLKGVRSKKEVSLVFNIKDIADIRTLIKSYAVLEAGFLALKEKVEFNNSIAKQALEELSTMRISMMHKDKQISQLISELEILKTKFEDLQPKKLSQRLDQIAQQANQYPSKFKQIEEKLSLLFKDSNKSKLTIDEIKAMKSFMKQFNKVLFKNLDKMEKLKLDAQKYSVLSEKAYAELNKNILDISSLDAKINEFQEKLDKLSAPSVVEQQKQEDVKEKLSFYKKKIAEWKKLGLDVSSLEEEVRKYE